VPQAADAIDGSVRRRSLHGRGGLERSREQQQERRTGWGGRGDGMGGQVGRW
jgi:hypothetical protein